MRSSTDSTFMNNLYYLRPIPEATYTYTFQLQVTNEVVNGEVAIFLIQQSNKEDRVFSRSI